MIRKLLLVLFSILSLHHAQAATCTSTGTGNWETIGTWSCGHVPTCGDSVVILATHTVTITSQIDLTGCATAMALSIKGTLSFQTGKKIDLPCGSRVYIFAGGRIDGNGGGSANLITICGTTVWKTSDGDITGPGCYPANDPRCSAFLPIELLYFKAVVCDKNVCLDWATETNNDFFTVEKSKDGFNFVSVGTIKGAGTTSLLNTYSSVDDNPHHGTSYYRLKQTDFDGKFTYSQIVAVDLQFNIYPNPALDNKVFIDVPLSYVGTNITVSIYDMLSRKIYSEHFPNAPAVITVNFGHLGSGVYNVSLNNDNGLKAYRQKIAVD